MEQLVAGVVRSAFGVRGALKVESVSGESEHLLKLASVTLRRVAGARRSGLASSVTRDAPNGNEHSGVQSFPVESSRRHGETLLVMKLAGIESPEQVREWNGAELLVSRHEAAQCGENEYYIADLVGLTIVHDGESVGTVLSVWDNGASDMLEVKCARGVQMIPFRSPFIGGVSVEEGTIELLTGWILE